MMEDQKMYSHCRLFSAKLHEHKEVLVILVENVSKFRHTINNICNVCLCLVKCVKTIITLKENTGGGLNVVQIEQCLKTTTA